MSIKPGEESIQQKLDMLKEQYRLQLEAKRSQLLQLWDLGVIKSSDTSLVGLYELLHQLAVSAKTFGYPEISILSKELEEKLKRFLADHLEGHAVQELNELQIVCDKLQIVIKEASSRKVWPSIEVSTRPSSSACSISPCLTKISPGSPAPVYSAFNRR